MLCGFNYKETEIDPTQDASSSDATDIIPVIEARESYLEYTIPMYRSALSLLRAKTELAALVHINECNFINYNNFGGDLTREESPSITELPAVGEEDSDWFVRASPKTLKRTHFLEIVDQGLCDKAYITELPLHLEPQKIVRFKDVTTGKVLDHLMHPNLPAGAPKRHPSKLARPSFFRAVSIIDNSEKLFAERKKAWERFKKTVASNKDVERVGIRSEDRTADTGFKCFFAPLTRGIRCFEESNLCKGLKEEVGDSYEKIEPLDQFEYTRERLESCNLPKLSNRLQEIIDIIQEREEKRQKLEGDRRKPEGDRRKPGGDRRKH